MQTITREELHLWLENNREFRLLETLPAQNYQEGHLPKAWHLPPDQVRQEAPNLVPDTDMPVVVYCASKECDASEKTYKILKQMGYQRVWEYPGGKEDWQKEYSLTREPVSTTS